MPLPRLPLLLALLLTACGGGGAAPPPTDVYLYLVAEDALGEPTGYTTRGDTSTTVEIEAHDFADWHLEAIVAHELWHVAGHDDHLGDGCMAGGVFPLDSRGPCADELARMAAVPFTFTLSPSDALFAATVRAAAWWNAAVGREMFVIG